MSFTDGYDTLAGSTITVPEAVAMPGNGPAINGSFGIPTAGSTFTVPIGGAGAGNNSGSVCFPTFENCNSPSYAPNFNQTFSNPLNPPTGSQSTPGAVVSTPSPGGGTATDPGTSTQNCTWSVFGFCLTQIFIVILGLIFIAAGLWMFAGRSQATALVSAVKGPLR